MKYCRRIFQTSVQRFALSGPRLSGLYPIAIGFEVSDEFNSTAFRETPEGEGVSGDPGGEAP